ncbi:DBP8 [Sanghuangporus weigelae]
MAKKDLRDLDDLSADDLLRRLESSEPRRKKRRLQVEEEPGAKDCSFAGFGEDGEDVQADSGESDGSSEGSDASSEIESTDSAEIWNNESLSEVEQVEERDDKQDIPSRASNEQAPRTSLRRDSRVLEKHKALDSSTSRSVSSFADLGASKALVASLASMSIRTPTEVQAACIPPLLAGRDCVGNAKTGSGKTIAFALPILQKLSVDPYGTYALVLTPTRELAFQISEQFVVLGAPFNIQTAVIVGGMDMIAQAIELNNRPHVVVATPGRIVDHLKSSSDEWDLSRVKFLVLDEADRLLTPSFASELAYLFKVLPKERQTCLFTATMTESIEELIAAPPRPGKQKPFVHRMTAPVETVETLEQFYLLVPSHVREPYLFYLLCNPPESIMHLRRAPPEPVKSSKKARTKSAKARKSSTDDQDVLEQPPPTMIFCARARTAAYLATLLQTLGIRSTALHSRLTQRARLNALGLFRARVVPVLICTDVGARGLDVDDIALVVNWDMPQEPEEYTHRVGRTARRGRTGLAVSFVTEWDEDRMIRVEGRIKTKLKEITLPEERVLEKLNAVATAKRLANMELHDSEFGKREGIHKIKHDKRLRLGVLEA